MLKLVVGLFLKMESYRDVGGGGMEGSFGGLQLGGIES
jgi:hypothetical protein